LDHFVAVDWAAFGVDLHLEVGTGRGTGAGRRVALERALREGIRSGRLAPQAKLPSTRSLAAELGLARGTVNAAYDQLRAEGYLRARTGSGTIVADLRSAPPTATPQPVDDENPRYDLRPGSPDVTSFPASAWVRSLRRALATAPPSIHGYGDPRGRVELRQALAEYLGRARGVRADPDRIVVVSGYVQALALLTTVLTGTGTGTDTDADSPHNRGAAAIAMEDPSFAFHRDIVRHHGADVVPLPVDGRGARTDLLSHKAFRNVRAVVVTPAHQYPMGVTMQPDRRHAATTWAAARDGFIIEDDYDGEFRYDRQPVGALQGTAPDRVIYVGTASKTLAPAVRLAWLVLPDALVEPVVDVKRYADLFTESIGQLTLADLIASHGYDRHVRSCRLRYRRRRDLLVARLRSHSLHGIAAGLHALVSLPPNGPSELDVLRHAATYGLAVGDLGSHWLSSPPAKPDRPAAGPNRPAAGPIRPTLVDRPQGIIVGYGTPSESGFAAALDTLARVLRTAKRGP
jgi:GntR family transcriptional regulator / MocR family aminotransferase